MTILVCAASKHGGTAGIARAIADELRSLEFDCELGDPEGVSDPSKYDAFVVGSAVYMGRWQESARNFLEANRRLLLSKPVWLFSSGPVGDNENVGIDHAELQRLIDTCNPDEHRQFAGKLDRSALGRRERFITRIVRAPEGDYRDWEAIRVWAQEIAGTLQLSEAEAV